MLANSPPALVRSIFNDITEMPHVRRSVTSKFTDAFAGVLSTLVYVAGCIKLQRRKNALGHCFLLVILVVAIVEFGAPSSVKGEYLQSLNCRRIGINKLGVKWTISDEVRLLL